MEKYRKGRVLTFNSKEAMEGELAKIREVYKAYPSREPGDYTVKIGPKRKPSAVKRTSGKGRGRRGPGRRR